MNIYGSQLNVIRPVTTNRPTTLTTTKHQHQKQNQQPLEALDEHLWTTTKYNVICNNEQAHNNNISNNNNNKTTRSKTTTITTVVSRIVN